MCSSNRLFPGDYNDFVSFPWAILFFPIAEVPDRFYADVNSLLYFVIKYGICLETDPVTFNFGKYSFAFIKTRFSSIKIVINWSGTVTKAETFL